MAFGGTGTFCRFKRVYIVSNYSVFAAAGAGPRSRRGASVTLPVCGGVRCTAKGSTVIRLRRNFQECLVTRTN